MLIFYSQKNKLIIQQYINIQNDDAIDQILLEKHNIIWIEMIDASEKERLIIEEHFEISIPLTTNQYDIDVPSRLYKKNDTLHLTINLVVDDDDQKKIDQIVFIMKKSILVTIKNSNDNIGRTISYYIDKMEGDMHSYSIFIAILDSITDKTSDYLEAIIKEMDIITNGVFEFKQSNLKGTRSSYYEALKNIGKSGDAILKVRESLTAINRSLVFVYPYFDSSHAMYLKNLIQDVNALSDHATFLSHRVNFLLDATLGMINNRQNDMIKKISMATIAFLPPTFIANLYGMNFKFMPGLNSQSAMIVVFLSMVLSGIIAYKLFQKKWK